MDGRARVRDSAGSTLSTADRADAPLSQISVGELNGRSLVGYVTDFDPTTPWVKLTKPTADGRYEPLRARLDLQAFASTEPFAALFPAESLSLRAHSLGGIALSGGAQQKDVLAAWAGLDAGQPQVFLTLIDKAEAHGHTRVVQMNTEVLANLDKMIGEIDQEPAGTADAS